MLSRKEQLFRTIVRQHIALGEPVGSKFLVEKSRMDCSPATVRNDMATLEQEGFLTHPHISAGRIPTEKGWKWYIEHFLEEQPLAKKSQEALAKASDDGDDRQQAIKHVARTLAELSAETAIVGFSPDDTYYTGLSNLFTKPEFAELNLVQQLSSVVDHLDSVMRDLFKSRDTDVRVLMGEDNPIDEHCSLVVIRLETTEPTVVALLGPMRMDYDQVLPLLRYTRGLI